jgi:hypothetical protein
MKKAEFVGSEAVFGLAQESAFHSFRNRVRENRPDEFGAAHELKLGSVRINTDLKAELCLVHFVIHNVTKHSTC